MSKIGGISNVYFKTQFKRTNRRRNCTMARVNAIANLKWDQIDLEERICSNVLEKEGKIVELSFSKETKIYLENLLKYREENGTDDHGWLFISPYVTDDKPIRNSTLNDWCKRIGSMIGVPTLHPHDFRHPYVKPTTKKFITFFEVFRAAS